MIKKLLLGLALVITSVNVSDAQSISFESSEGYSLGNINAQSSWVTTGCGTGCFVANQVVSTEQAYAGTNSLKITQESAYGTQSSLSVGAFYSLSSPLSTQYSASARYYIAQQAGANDSDFGMYLVGSTSYIAMLRFSFDGKLYTVESGNWTEIVGVTWTVSTWQNVQITVNGSVVSYYLNGTLIKTGATVSAENFQQIRFVNDNYGGSAYVDSISIQNTLSANSNELVDFKLYPNPVKDIVTVEVGNNVAISKLTLTDINGRIVKEWKIQDKNLVQVSVSDLNSGVYFASVETNEGNVVRKIVKE